MARIYLSPPHPTGREHEFVDEAISSNWLAPLGPHVDAFERELSAVVGVPNAVALSSGTAALHLALVVLGIGAGDEVVCSSLTFAASANAIRYTGAATVFVDCDAATWTMDPELLDVALTDRRRQGGRVRAVLAVDLYGQCCDYDALQAVCDRHEVILLQDAAESLGATYNGRPSGVQGLLAAFSFNGNKIITSSGGGMLVSSDEGMIEHARKLSTQARDIAPHYEHSELGFNYRLSNVLAGIGRGQLRALPDRIAARKAVRHFYQTALGNLPGIDFLPHSPHGEPNYWLTCITVDPAEFGATREDIRLALEAGNIEARPVWKPLHLQPVFSACRVRGGQVSAGIFDRGLCLPSGSTLTETDLTRICDTIRRVHHSSSLPRRSVPPRVAAVVP